MGVQAIDQNIWLEVLKTTWVFYWPRPTAEGNRTLRSFSAPKAKCSDLLPKLPFNNCFITLFIIF